MAIRDCNYIMDNISPEKEPVLGNELYKILREIEVKQNYLTNTVIWLLQEKRIMLPINEISTKDIIESIRDRDDITVFKLRAGKMRTFESDKDAIALIFENEE